MFLGDFKMENAVWVMRSATSRTYPVLFPIKVEKYFLPHSDLVLFQSNKEITNLKHAVIIVKFLIDELV